jgi:uncharacterized spore protein YtfJ
MKIALPILLLILMTGLGACTGQSRAPERQDGAGSGSGSGPTVYGQASVSVDHVDIR